MEQQLGFGAPFLDSDHHHLSKTNEKKSWRRALLILLAVLTLATLGLVAHLSSDTWKPLLAGKENEETKHREVNDIVESEHGVVAADDGRCSEIGASTLRDGGHAVDAAVATTLCLGVVNPMSSGVGGGGFMVVHSSSPSQSHAFDLRETAPLAASQDMYAKNPNAKYAGALSMGVPGEIAGLHAAWLKYGRLPWRTLFQPAIHLAKDGFIVAPYLASAIKYKEKMIMDDPGLRQVFAPNGKLLAEGETCYNIELAHSLEAVAVQGPQAFYNGAIGENFIKDVRESGGILTMKDLRNYQVRVMNAMVMDVMGYTILGMPPPSSGTLGLSMVSDPPYALGTITSGAFHTITYSQIFLGDKQVLNILDSYGASDDAMGSLGLHRLVEALKHMFAIRMNLGDPDFINATPYISDMLSPSFANEIQKKINDNTTFPPDYYMNRWSQLRDHGTSHFCIVDGDRNAVSMTTTVNYYFGAGVLSPSTGIVLNNEMGDFSTPTEIFEDQLPPAPANFIAPKKRPLSSMTPVIILKDNQLVGVIGGSGGMYIIPAVIQVFLNHFILGMEPLSAVQHPRVYHKLKPNVVLYENWTVIDGDHIELSDENRLFLAERNHQLEGKAGGAICQLVVQTLQTLKPMGRKVGAKAINEVVHGMLTAVSDPRKDGRPAAV